LIKETRPKVILAVGGRTAAYALCGPGTLTKLITDRESAQDWSGRNTRSTFQLIKPVVANVPYVVPMPHTSPRVMNNPKWQPFIRRQIELAVKLWRA
jgi:uracil-DNA glycosylase